MREQFEEISIDIDKIVSKTISSISSSLIKNIVNKVGSEDKIVIDRVHTHDEGLIGISIDDKNIDDEYLYSMIDDSMPSDEAVNGMLVKWSELRI